MSWCLNGSRTLPSGRESKVVIVGAGFAGLAAAHGLRRAPVRITIVDRSNHHLFQPLLYQVATAAAQPRRHRRARFVGSFVISPMSP